MSVQAKRELLLQVACRYREAAPAHKTIILDEFVARVPAEGGCGYARKYAIRLLARPAPPPVLIRRPRERRYGPAVQAALATCWSAANEVCAKRLVPFLPELVDALERHGHLTLSAEDRERLVGISAATADRLLRPLREHQRVHGVSTTKPAALIKRQIPVRTFQDWDDARPGCLEIDLVAHCGWSAEGGVLADARAHRRRHGLDGMPTAALPQPRHRAGGARSRPAAPTLPGGRPGHRQRRPVHERRAARLLRAGAAHFHPRSHRQEDRPMLRRAEERFDRAPAGRLRPVRGRGGLPAARRTLPGGAPVREFLPAVDEARHEAPRGRRHPAHVRAGQDALPAAGRGRGAERANPDATDGVGPGARSRAVAPSVAAPPGRALAACRLPHARAAAAGRRASARPAPSCCGAPTRRRYSQASARAAAEVSAHGEILGAALRPGAPGTRADPFAEVWAEVVAWLDAEPTRTGTSVFAELQRRHPGRFADGQRRTLHRRVREWRARRILAFDARWVEDEPLGAGRLPRPLRVLPAEQPQEPALAADG